MLSDPHILRWLIALTGLVFTLGALVMLAQRYGQHWRKKMHHTLRLVEQISLDSRYKLVVVEDGKNRHTLVLGPQQALVVASALHKTPSQPTKKKTR